MTMILLNLWNDQDANKSFDKKYLKYTHDFGNSMNKGKHSKECTPLSRDFSMPLWLSFPSCPSVITLGTEQRERVRRQRWGCCGVEGVSSVQSETSRRDHRSSATEDSFSRSKVPLASPPINFNNHWLSTDFYHIAFNTMSSEPQRPSTSTANTNTAAGNMVR